MPKKIDNQYTTEVDYSDSILETSPSWRSHGTDSNNIITTDAAATATVPHVTGTAMSKVVSTAAATPPASAVMETILMSMEEYLLASSILYKIQYVFVAIAFVVTCINIAVFTRPRMRSSTSRYVVALGVTQIFYLFIDIGSHINEAIVTDTTTSAGYWIYIYYFQNLGFALVRRGTYAVQCLVCLERLYAIVRPLHIKSFFLSRYPVTSIVTTYVLNVLFHLYIPSRLAVKQIGVSKTSGKPLYRIMPTQYYLDNYDLLEGVSLSAKILWEHVPLILLILLNILTLVFLRRHTLKRRAMKTTGDEEAEAQRQRQMTVTIMGASIAYTVLSLPFALHALMTFVDTGYSATGGDPRVRWFFVFIQRFSYICVLVTCVTDFLSFVLLSSAYRRTLLQLMPRYFSTRLVPPEELKTTMQSFSSISEGASTVTATTPQ